MLIAGTQSGCGKTTVTLALMQYLRGQNYSIAPFKAGPDFLDPMWHAVACDRTSYNLDTRMMGVDVCTALFVDKSTHADVCVIEGVMGLFDGVNGVGGEGSSAHLAHVLNEPVLLVVNAKGMSGSIVPLVEGFVARCENITGVIANHVGSENHARILCELLVEFELPPLVAWMGKNAPQLPERHLGLVMPEENGLPDFSENFHVEKDIKSFTAETRRAQRDTEKSKHNFLRQGESSLRARGGYSGGLCGKVVAVARDTACCFIYPANIEWLEEAGAALVFFSPLAGESVPENADALWLPGGYPELHAELLSTSASWSSIRDFIEADKPVLAECGGMMVLGESIVMLGVGQGEKEAVKMAAVLPCQFVMQDRLAGLGYREDESGMRGHEFHHSKRELTAGAHHSSELQQAFDMQRGDPGMRYKNLRASYVHWYFASQPDVIADWFGGSDGY